MSFSEMITELEELRPDTLHGRSFQSLRDKSDKELGAVFAAADALRDLWGRNLSARVFDGGFALLTGGESPLFRWACGLLGLDVLAVEADDVPWLPAEVLGCLDVPLPGLAIPAVSLAGDVISPLAEALFLIHAYGGVERLRDKKILVSCGEDCAEIPPGVGSAVTLMTRFGAHVQCTLQPGQTFPPAWEEEARSNAERTGGRFSLGGFGAFHPSEADVVLPDASGRGLEPFILGAVLLLIRAGSPADALRGIEARGRKRGLI